MLCLQAQKTLFLTQKTQYVVSSKNLQSIISAVIMCASTATKHSATYSAQRSTKRTAHNVLVYSACTLPSKHRPVKAAHLHSKRTAPLTAGGSYKPAQHSAHTTANTHSKRIIQIAGSVRGPSWKVGTGVPWKVNTEQGGYRSTTASRQFASAGGLKVQNAQAEILSGVPGQGKYLTHEGWV